MSEGITRECLARVYAMLFTQSTHKKKVLILLNYFIIVLCVFLSLSPEPMLDFMAHLSEWVREGRARVHFGEVWCEGEG